MATGLRLDTFWPFAAALLLCGASANVTALTRGTTAHDQFGDLHPLVDPSARYTVVDFAAWWCEPCHRALPRLQELAEDHPEIRFLVVSIDEEAKERDRLVRELDLRLPVLWDGDHAIVERFRPRGFPATYVLDTDGEIVYHHTGDDPKKWHRLVAFLGQAESTD